MSAKMAANGIRTHARMGFEPMLAVRIPFVAIFADIPRGRFKLMTSRLLFFKFDMEAFIPREKVCLLDCLD